VFNQFNSKQQNQLSSLTRIPIQSLQELKNHISKDYREEYIKTNKKRPSNQERERFYQAYMTFSLVKITWVLVIVTILLMFFK